MATEGEDAVADTAPDAEETPTQDAADDGELEDVGVENGADGDGLEGQLKSGWIFKEGRTVRIVMKRWLELDGSDLQYKSAQGGETKRVINLEEVNIELVPRTVGKVQTQALKFYEDDSSMPIFSFYCETEAESQEWYDVLLDSGALEFVPKERNISEVLMHMHVGFRARDRYIIAGLAILSLMVAVSTVTGGALHSHVHSYGTLSQAKPLCEVVTPGGGTKLVEAMLHAQPLQKTWIEARFVVNGTVCAQPNQTASSAGCGEEWRSPRFNILPRTGLRNHDALSELMFRVGESKIGAVLDSFPTAHEFCLFTGSPTPLGIRYDIFQLGALGEMQVGLGVTLLVLFFLSLVSEMCNATVAAFVSSLLSLLILYTLHKLPSLKIVMEWMDESTLALIFGLMIMVHSLSTTGLFEWSAVRAIKFTDGSLPDLFAIFCILSCLISSVFDNVATVLVMVPVVTVTCNGMLHSKKSAIPFIISVVIFSNIGGAASPVGGPSNIIIMDNLPEYASYWQFLWFSAPCAATVAIIMYHVLRFLFRGAMVQDSKVDIDELLERFVIHHKPHLYECGFVFATVALLFFTQPVHEMAPGWIAIIGALMVLLITNPKDIQPALEHIEWDTILFFGNLFIFIRALEEMFVFDTILNWILDTLNEGSTDSTSQGIFIFLWLSVVGSMFLNNIPTTMLLSKTILMLSTGDKWAGAAVEPFIWSLSLGASLGGAATLVSAGANLVAVSSAGKYGVDLKFMRFATAAVPGMIVSVVLANIYLLLVFSVGIPGIVIGLVAVVGELIFFFATKGSGADETVISEFGVVEEPDDV